MMNFRLLLVALFALVALLVLTSVVSAAAADKKTEKQAKKPNNNNNKPSDDAASKATKKEKKPEDPAAADSDTPPPFHQQQAATNIKNGVVQTVIIKGALSNVTRTVRDKATGQVRKLLPGDVARISINGGAHVFFSDSHGQFQIELPLPVVSVQQQQQPGARAARTRLHQIDVDWHKMAFPRVLVEVDEFSNFRAYVDGDGKIVASKGRVGIDSSTAAKNRFEVVDDMADDADFASQSELAYMQIPALGEMEYYVPRQQFSPLDLVKNPMVLMMGVTAIMVFVMPKLMDADEMKSQMKELQKMKDGK